MYNLSEIEKNEIREYLISCGSPVYDLDAVLDNWAKAKSKYLFGMFGDSLSFTLENTTNVSSIEAFFKSDTAKAIFDRLKGYIAEDSSLVSPTPIEELLFNKGMAEDNFMDFKGGNYVISFKETNSRITLNHGAKYTNFVKRLLKHYDKEATGFEDWATSYSKYRSIGLGDLTFSIHPMDYFTMSENEYGWSSCMDMHDGEMRSGVVEMLNSPSTIVCYSQGSHASNRWLGKRFRVLATVTPEVAIVHLGYPNHNNDLSIKILKELVDRSPFAYDETLYYKTSCVSTLKPVSINDTNMVGTKTIYMDREFMYADCDCSSNTEAKFYSYINSDILTDLFTYRGPSFRKGIEFSGRHTCLSCGSYYSRNSSSICCYDCGDCDDDDYDEEYDYEDGSYIDDQVGLQAQELYNSRVAEMVANINTTYDFETFEMIGEAVSQIAAHRIYDEQNSDGELPNWTVRTASQVLYAIGFKDITCESDLLLTLNRIKEVQDMDSPHRGDYVRIGCECPITYTEKNMIISNQDLEKFIADTRASLERRTEIFDDNENDTVLLPEIPVTDEELEFLRR